MYQCSECGLLIGPPDQDYCDEPSRPCPSCRIDDAPYDADELGLDPEEDDDLYA